jgi:5-methylcytosine-specific restriction endonuclease McrA
LEVSTKKYRQANAAKIAAYNAAYRAANAESLKAYEKRRRSSGRARAAVDKYQAKNPDKVKKNRDDWRSKNPEYARKYRSDHREEEAIRAKAWRKENAEIVRANIRNRRARLRAASGSHTASDIKDIFRLQKGKCAQPWCRIRLGTDYHTDHIISLAAGGSNGRENLQLLCRTCNLQKHVKDPMEWNRQHGLLL